MTIHARRSTLALFALLACTGASAFGCSAEPETYVRPNVSVVSSALMGFDAENITALNGTYSGACDGRTGGDTWSVGANGNSTLDHAALSVRMNDSNCVLTLTEIKVSSTVYATSADIALGSSYAGSPSAFKDVDLDPIDFYANAKLSSTSFADDFTIPVSLAADPNDTLNASKQGAFATQSSTVVANDVVAPNYTAGMGSFTLETDVNDVVSATDGYAQLTAGSATGQGYAIYNGALPASTAPNLIATAYAGAAFTGLLSALTTLRLTHDMFDLLEEDLTAGPVTRTIILRNLDAESGVASYQLIAVAFSKP